jgi:Malectin domain
VAAIDTSKFAEQTNSRADLERQEFEWLLTSGVLGRSDNLARVLKYICEEHFQGRDEHIKEYAIAVEALGRRSAFDPQTDTIVRVTFHSLRKRLMEIYQNEGANHPVRLVIPPGHYAPFFVHQTSVNRTAAAGLEHAPASLAAEVRPATSSAASAAPTSTAEKQHRRGLVVFWVWPVATILLVVALLATWFGARAYKKERVAHFNSSTSLPLPAPQATIHALMGSDRAPYVDHSGNTWSTANYCQGGTNISVPQQRIEGTEDAPLYFGGVRGIVHCTFPVTQSMYEVHFHFAETSDLPMAAPLDSISINAAPAFNVDVVDYAGGRSIATSTIVTGVAPENDGSIHLDFISELSLLNAVEILPAPSARQLPVRIVSSASSYTDDAKQVWSSDRYFSGGRHGRLPPKVANISDLGIYQSDRVGRFRYNIPAVPFARYRVRLYFREPWFGKENGGNGGPGSRIFDVACNGVLLLKNFDILAEGNSKPIVKTFDNVQASAGGRIELYFMPVVNYPAVNAIEVLPED